MPIGKNAIKRVSNNGYSNIASTAPDMESGVVKTEVKQEKNAKKSAPVSNKTEVKKTTPAKKSVSKTNTASKTDSKTVKKAAVKAPKTVADPTPVLKSKVGNDTRVLDNGCINIGGTLPIYLL